MNDRELLELAAKAAGIELFDGEHGDKLRVYYTCPHTGLNRYAPWNPLTDDGDALRLAVKLRLEPRFIDNSHSQGAEPSRVTMHNIAGIVENIGDDPYAATRRAIVRAAAEIGKGV